MPPRAMLPPLATPPSVLALHGAILTPPPRPVHRTMVGGHAVGFCSGYSVVTGIKMWGDKVCVML